MAALGDRPAREVTTREVEDLLRTIAATGAAPRTANKARQLVCAIFNYGMRPSTYALATNPAQDADRRREPDQALLAFYSPGQVEALAQALSAGAHRDPTRPAVSDEEAAARAHDDAQDAELVRVAAYAGLRRGELVALRWRDVDFTGQKLIVRRALSGETEVRSTKSRRAREVPSLIKPRLRFGGFSAAASSPVRMTTSSPTASDAAWTPLPCAAATSAPATPPASTP
jgi:integrase